MQYAKYTFFEVATQKGYLMAVLADLLPRHWVREVVSTTDGTEFILSAKRNLHDEEPTWFLAVNGRTARESTQMWQERVRGETIQAWDRFAKEEQARVAVLKAEQENLRRQQAQADDRAQREADSKAAALLIGASAAVLAPEVPAPEPRAKAKAKGKTPR